MIAKQVVRNTMVLSIANNFQNLQAEAENLMLRDPSVTGSLENNSETQKRKKRIVKAKKILKSMPFNSGGSEADQSSSQQNQSDLTFGNSRRFPDGSTLSATDDQRSKNPSALNSSKTGKIDKISNLEINIHLTPNNQNLQSSNVKVNNNDRKKLQFPKST